LFLILFISTKSFANEYIVPRSAYSVTAGDLDLDGDNDIVVGHNFNFDTDWGGITILNNDGEGLFTIQDSIYLWAWQTNIFAVKINNDDFPDIVGRHFEDETSYISVSEYEQGNYNNEYHEMNYTIDEFSIGDLNDDGDLDIVFCSNNGQFWGYMTNNGYGDFSQPIYYNLDYHPGGITCGDLNNDGKDDIVVCGLKLEVYWSNGNGFDLLLIDEPNYMGNVKIADMNNDGYNDIVTETWYTPGHEKDISIYYNDGQHSFEDTYVKVVEEAASELVIADLFNDNYPDVIYNVSYSYPNSQSERINTYILLNNGNNTLQDPLYYQTYLGNSEYVASFKSFVIDIDNNNLKDILTVNYSYNESSLHILYNDGTGNFVENPQVGINEEYIINKKISLLNYPNPFNPITTISYDLPVNVENPVIEIFNVKGEKVKSLCVFPNGSLGTRSVVWDGTDNYRKPVSSGVYFYRIKTNDFVSKTKKMILLK